MIREGLIAPVEAPNARPNILADDPNNLNQRVNVVPEPKTGKPGNLLGFIKKLFGYASH
jgi:hypothetical protein